MDAPKLVGRLNKYVPIYDINKRKQKCLEDDEFEWLTNMVDNYKVNKDSSKPPNENNLPTYHTVRHPTPIKKVSLSVLTTASTLKAQLDVSKSDVNTRKEQFDTEIKENKKLVKSGLTNPSYESVGPHSTPHLPQLMKSFLPSTNRKLPMKPSTNSKSSWVHLTSQKKVKQVTRDYKHYPQKPYLSSSRVIVFNENNQSNVEKKLHRRPLPPIIEAPQVSRFEVSDLAPIWQPLSLTIPYLSKPNFSLKDSNFKILESYFNRFGNKKPPNLLPCFFSNEGDKGSTNWSEELSEKVLKSRRIVAQNPDRRTGFIRGKVALNKFPSDLMGNVRTNFQNLECYLGRVNCAEKKSQVLYIPTGRLGEEEQIFSGGKEANYPKYPEMVNKEEVYENVKIKYAHRRSSDTLSLDQLPWTEKRSLRILRDTPPSKMDDNATVQRKQNQVKRVTINMPKVPPPSRESHHEKLTSRETVCRPMMDQQVQVNRDQERAKITGQKIVAEIPNKQVSSIQKEHHVTGDEVKQLTTIQHVSTHSKLINRLVDAHGDLKKKHKCSQKEVVIAPFKVKIDGCNTTSTKSDAVIEDAVRKQGKHDLTKSFNFSCLPSKNKIIKRQRLHNHPEFAVFKTPDVFNQNSNSPPNKNKSIISSFVSVNQSNQIYQALLMENEDTKQNDYSLNKASECDDLDEAVIASPRNVKGENVVKPALLSRSSNIADISKPIAAL